MLEHIVKNGESIYDILNMYHLDIETLKGYNLHITDLYNLASGIKIKIPLISNEIEQILENTESFVQKYYPIVEDYTNNFKEENKENIKSNETVNERPLTKGIPYPGIIPPKTNR